MQRNRGLGATTNTFGTPGADKYCQFLKSVGDGLATRAELVDLLETASVRSCGARARREHPWRTLARRCFKQRAHVVSPVAGAIYVVRVHV